MAGTGLNTPDYDPKAKEGDVAAALGSLYKLMLQGELLKVTIDPTLGHVLVRLSSSYKVPKLHGQGATLTVALKDLTTSLRAVRQK